MRRITKPVSLAYDEYGQVTPLIGGKVSKKLDDVLWTDYDGNVEEFWHDITNPEKGLGAPVDAKTDKAVRRGLFR